MNGNEIRSSSLALRGRLRERWLTALVGLCVSAGLVVFALRTLDLGAVRASVAEMRAIWLVPALATIVVAFVLRVLRWQLLFDDPRSRPPLVETGRALLVGLGLNAVLPFRAGDVARLVLLHRRTSLPRLRVLSTIGVERVYDVVALLVLLVLALPWLPDAAWLHRLALVAALAVAAVVLVSALLVGWGERVARVVVWPLRWLPRVSAARRESAQRNILAGVAALRRARPAAIATGLTVATWLVFWLSYWLLLQGFDLGVGPAAALLVLVATGFSLAVPSGPGAVGVFEAAVIVALLPFDVAAEAALSYALVLHALHTLPYVLAALAALPRAQRPGAPN